MRCHLAAVYDTTMQNKCKQTESETETTQKVLGQLNEGDKTKQTGNCQLDLTDSTNNCRIPGFTSKLPALHFWCALLP